MSVIVFRPTCLPCGPNTSHSPIQKSKSWLLVMPRVSTEIPDRTCQGCDPLAGVQPEQQVRRHRVQQVPRGVTLDPRGRVAPRALGEVPDHERDQHRGHRAAAPPQVGARALVPAPEHHLDRDRGHQQGPERQVAALVHHRHGRVEGADQLAGRDQQQEHLEEEHRALSHQPHQGVRRGEGRDQVHAQQVEAAAELGLGGVHRGAGGPEQHGDGGVRRGQARQPRRARRPGGRAGRRTRRSPARPRRSRRSRGCWPAGPAGRGRAAARRSRSRGRRPAPSQSPTTAAHSRPTDATAVAAATASGRRSRVVTLSPA